MKRILKWVAWFLVAVAVKATIAGFAHRARADEYVMPPVGIATEHADGSWTDRQGALHRRVDDVARAKGYDGGELIQYPNGYMVARGFIMDRGQLVAYHDWVDAVMVQSCVLVELGNWSCTDGRR